MSVLMRINMVMRKEGIFNIVSAFQLDWQLLGRTYTVPHHHQIIIILKIILIIIDVIIIIIIIFTCLIVKACLPPLCWTFTLSLSRTSEPPLYLVIIIMMSISNVNTIVMMMLVTIMMMIWCPDTIWQWPGGKRGQCKPILPRLLPGWMRRYDDYMII